MQTRPFGTLRRFVSTLSIAATVVMPYAAMVPAAHAADTVYQEDFGTGSDSGSFSTGWSKHEAGTIAKSPVPSPSEDSASSNGGRFAKIAEDSNDGGPQDGYICREVDAEDYIALTLAYEWRGDADAESDDYGQVEARDNGNGDATCSSGGGWDSLNSHSLASHSTWSAQGAFDISEYAGSKFLIRFRNESSADDEYFRVDAITILGTKKPKPDLIVTKTSDVKGAVQPGESFTWTIRIENTGSASAFFDDEEEIFRDDLPYGEDFADYSDLEWTTSGVTGTSQVSCSISPSYPPHHDNENLRCEATEAHGNPDGLTIAPGGYIEVTVQANLNEDAELGAVENPRENGYCRVDKFNRVQESDESNNNCSDVVYIGYEPAVIVVRKVADGPLLETNQFGFELREGDVTIDDGFISAPAPLPTISFDVSFTDASRSLSLVETEMPLGWHFSAVSCALNPGDEDEESVGEATDGHGIAFSVFPGDEVLCTFVNGKNGGSSQQTGTLVVEKYIRGGSLSFDEFRFEVDGGSLGFNGYFDESGRNTFENAPVGEYSVSEEAPEGYTATYGGDCDETGVVSVANNETSTCRVTNTADGWEEGDGETGPEPTDDPDSGGGSGDDDGNLGTLIVKKVILFGEDASVSFSDFGFSVASMSAQFEEDGENELQLEAGDYTVAELDAPGFTNAFSGDCDENGNVLVPEGATKVCTITNTAGVGGFNPGSDIPAPIETPTPTPTPTPTGTGGGVTGGSLGGPAGENDDVPASESAPASPSADSLLTASIGSMGDFPLCVPGGLWWVLVNLVLYFLALLWLQRGEFNLGKAVIVLVLLAAVLIWVANACTNNPLWLPAALSVLALLWLRLRGRKDA